MAQVVNMVNTERTLSVSLVELLEMSSWLRAAVAIERMDTPRFATLLHLLNKVEELLNQGPGGAHVR